jgi:tripartite-type tricarboxylate transporter receptor subunit TctC
MPLAPDVPTVGEAGFATLLAENFLGVSAPAGVPQEVIDKVHKAVSEVIMQPTILKRFEEMGIAVDKMSQPEFAAFVSKQVADWGPAVKATGARLN